MKKRLILLLMLFSICFILGACTSTTEIKLLTSYVPETRQCIIKNANNSNYKDLRVTLLAQSDNGFDKEIVCNVGNLEEGETYTYEIKDEEIPRETKINNIVIKSYDYYYSGIVVLALIVLFMLILSFAVFTIIY